MTSPHLNKKEAVRGIAAYLGANYGVTWANEKVASEVCDYVADQIQGPDTLPESGLHPESALKIAQMIIKTHENLAPKGFTGEPDALRKTAAGWSVADLAVATAQFDMNMLAKQADSMIMTGGQHTNRAGESPDALAKLDQHNRPQGEYLVGMGNTDLKPSGHAILGKEEPHPHAPSNTSPTPNSVTEHSKAADLRSALTGTAPVGQALREYAGDIGSSLSGMAGKAKDAISGAAGKGMDAAKAVGGQMSPGGAAVGAGLGALGAGGAAYAASDDENALRNALLAGGAGAVGGGALGGLVPGMVGAYGMSQGMDAAAQNRMGMPPLQLPPGGGSSFPNVAPEMHMPAPKSAADLSQLLKSAQEIGLSDEQTVALLRKMASGGSLTDTKSNTPEDAAKHDQIAELDQKNRSTDKYLKGMGKTDMPNVGRVEHAAKRPDQPGGKEKAPDTVASRETKSAADEAFTTLFRKTAEDVGPHLPTNMDQNTKIGHVRMMMGMSTDERAAYLKALANQ